MTRFRFRLFAACACLAILAVQPAAATVIIAPVFDKVAGTGPTAPLVFETYSGPDPTYAGAFVLGFYNPGITPTSLTADEPGETVEFGAGVPSDPTLVTSTVFSNNTNFVMTGFTLHIAGYAEQQSADPLDLIFVADPNVDAIFGDAAAGLVSSNVFPTYSISPDGKTISFSGGEVRIGDLFVNYIFSEISGIHSDFTPGNQFAQNIAYIQASFEGYEIPLPAAAPLMLAGLGGLGVFARRRPREPRA